MVKHRFAFYFVVLGRPFLKLKSPPFAVPHIHCWLLVRYVVFLLFVFIINNAVSFNVSLLLELTESLCHRRATPIVFDSDQFLFQHIQELLSVQNHDLLPRLEKSRSTLNDTDPVLLSVILFTEIWLVETIALDKAFAHSSKHHFLSLVLPKKVP